MTLYNLYYCSFPALGTLYYYIPQLLSKKVSKSFFHQKGFVTWISIGNESLLHPSFCCSISFQSNWDMGQNNRNCLHCFAVCITDTNTYWSIGRNNIIITLFKNYSKCGIWILEFWHFLPIKTDLSGNTVWPQASGYQNSPKWTIFGILNFTSSFGIASSKE